MSTPEPREQRASTRLKGHALAHLAYRPGAGWVWSCECLYRPPAYTDSAAIARTEHREHKARLGTPAEHATIQIWRSTRGLQARCICGCLLGASETIEATEAAHRLHQKRIEAADER